MNDYMKFNKLLSWFVNQLNINNGVIDGETITGFGYKEDSSLRKYYSDWRNYTDFNLDCTLNHKYGDYATRSSYINLENTGLNIIPEFDSKSKAVKSVYIANREPNVSVERKSESVSTARLALNDDEPNQALNDFFDMYKQHISEYKDNMTPVVDEREQRAAFKQWYVNNGRSANSANTISTALGKTRLKDGRTVFSILYYDELNKIISTAGLEGYYEARDGDYSKMDRVFDFDSNTQRDDFKNGMKFYLQFLNIKSESDSPAATTHSYWLGGASYGDVGDVSQSFIECGIFAIGFEKVDISNIVSNPSDFTDWINKIPENRARKAFELLSKMKTGDKIAIKAAYAKGKTSMLRIKAIGTIKEDFENGYRFDNDFGHTIPVDWTPKTPFSDYELGGYLSTIHRVTKREDIDMIFYSAKKNMEEDLSVHIDSSAAVISLKDDFYYNNGITMQQWLEMIDASVINVNDIELLRKWLYYDGQATCSEVGKTFNAHPTAYIAPVYSMARRVKEYTDCKTRLDNKGDVAWWNIPFVGKYINRKEHFEWIIRPELKEALTERGVTPLEPLTITDYTKEDFLLEVYFDSDEYDEIVALLDRKKNIILQGAPGVGKSYMAKRLAYSIIGAKDDSKVSMIQFHQSYSYEDFIEGYRPSGDGGFTLEPGVFYDFCTEKAKTDEANYISCINSDDEDVRKEADKYKHFFIIDEINRGRIEKIMGELMFLLENDKRGEEFSIKLTYSGEPFYVPKNVFIIGMMNTADRSLAMMDYALRRRFSFVPISPVFGNDGFISYIKKDDESLGEKILAEMKALNDDITNDLGSGFQIGHSFFCNCDKITDDWYKSVLKYEIIPLLDEYWFDNEKQHSKWVKGLLPDA